MPADRSVLSAIGSHPGYLHRALAWIAEHATLLAKHDPERRAVEALSIQLGNTVLELGCARGEVMRLVVPRLGCGIVHGVDPSVFSLQQAARRNRRAVHDGSIYYHKARFEALPFPDASIDRVIAVNSFRAWQDPGRVIGELARVMKPSGLLCIYAPNRAARGDRLPVAANAGGASGPADLASLFKAQAGLAWDYHVQPASRGVCVLLLASPRSKMSVPGATVTA